MASLPSNVRYGMITGKFVRAVTDTMDEGQDPDGVPIVGVRATFTPNFFPAVVRNRTTSPPTTILLEPIHAATNEDGVLTVLIQDESNNWILPPYGSPTGVKLVASMDPNLDPNGWTWTVDIEASNTFPNMTFTFAVPVNSELDLTTLVNQPASPGNEILEWQAAVAATAASVQAAVELLAEIEAVRDEMVAVPVATDEIFRDLILADDSETTEALASRYARIEQVMVGVDEDGIPYFSAGIAFKDATPVLSDTDGVPYVML